MSRARIVGVAAIVLVCAVRGSSAAESALITAVKALDVATARALIARHVNVNAPQADGTTALHWAAENGSADLVELLLAAGADARAANRYGVTPLALAAGAGDATAVERLLGKGADANARRGEGETVLMAGARGGNAHVITALLAHGARINDQEETRGQTALMWAAAQGNTAAVRALIEAGADVSLRARGPVEPPLAAAEFTRSRYTRQGRVDDYSALMMAVRRGHIDTVRVLLDGGADVNDASSDGMSALVLACANAHWELAALLVERGANPNAAGQGWAALHQVARTRSLSPTRIPHPVATGSISSLDLVKVLLAHGADVNQRVTKRFHSDEERGRFNTVGATALLMAAKGFDHDLMRLLLANGADPTLRNRTHSSILLAAAGCEVTFPGEDSGAPEDSLESVKIALAAGADPNEVNDDGDTALHGAAFTGADGVVRLLVERGARLDVKNRKGMMPVATAHMDWVATILQTHPRTEALLRSLMEQRGLTVVVYEGDELRARTGSSGQ
jgi:ankyrin repeat protein